jgi:DNA excision repair protein ERCC-3
MLYASFRNGDIRSWWYQGGELRHRPARRIVAIQVSGTFGSRQEEAQRLGRILRPKERVSTFYTLVTRETSEEIFAHRRQVFLAEQGYKYRIEEWSLDDINA